MTWKMVPVEPSTDSRWAGAKKKNAYRLVGGRKANPYEIYQAMLAAAPKYEPTPEQVERAARAIREKVPYGYGMSDDETITYARAVLMTLEG